MPIAVALVAGALAGVNPCGFPLLPAYLSFYVGADERSPLSGSARLAQGLLVGGVLSAGFMAVFAALGVPISYGATHITKAVPWAGLAVGAAMVLLGGAVVAGRSLRLPMRASARVSPERGLRSAFAFGATYALCSLGCTLLVFLALIGASLATSRVETLVVFAAYALGMTTTLMALSIAAALVRQGLARALKRLLPHMQRIAGVLLVVSGAYLSYYWARVLWAPPEALADDPLVGAVSSFSNWIQRAAASGGGRWAVLGAGVVVAAAIAGALWPKTASEAKPRPAVPPVTVSPCADPGREAG